MTTIKEKHKIGVDLAIEYLTDNGISVKPSNESKIDLVLDNGKTIYVKPSWESDRIQLTTGSLDTLKSDYLLIITKVKFTVMKVYLIPIENVKLVADNKPMKKDGKDNYYINSSNYISYYIGRIIRGLTSDKIKNKFYQILTN